MVVDQEFDENFLMQSMLIISVMVIKLVMWQHMMMVMPSLHDGDHLDDLDQVADNDDD